eukprot:gene13992-14107_t
MGSVLSTSTDAKQPSSGAVLRPGSNSSTTVSRPTGPRKDGMALLGEVLSAAIATGFL